jgi:hypothetical protein
MHLRKGIKEGKLEKDGFSIDIYSKNEQINCTGEQKASIFLSFSVSV